MSNSEINSELSGLPPLDQWTTEEQERMKMRAYEAQTARMGATLATQEVALRCALQWAAGCDEVEPDRIAEVASQFALFLSGMHTIRAEAAK